MPQLLVRFVQDNSGATAIEYSLIATLIALAIIAEHSVQEHLRPGQMMA
jgi:Flp pilus assembly pilin Flp